MAETAQRLPWISVTVASLALLWALIWLWYGYECCGVSNLKKLTTEDEVQVQLEEAGADGLFRLPTGIYVQSLSFESANDVQVTGRIWQRVPAGETLPQKAKVGVLFPDAISAHEGNLTPIYQDVALPGGGRLFVWNFQVTLRQFFDYEAYPLDGKLVWIRFWINDINNKIQLVPDLNGYFDRALDSGMGMSDSLVSGEWTDKKSFFGYKQITYDTDFGRNRGWAEAPKPSRPELRFYIVLRRNFTDAFLVNLVPFFVTMGLLFGLTMTVSRNTDEAERLGFNTLAVFGSCAGLFFIVLVGHIQIRQQFAGSQIVYIEYFYILSYLVLLVVSVFSFWVTYAANPRNSILLRNNGRGIKMLYWPVLLAVLVLMTYYLIGTNGHEFTI